MNSAESVVTKTLEVLERITGTDEVRLNRDLALYDLDVLDSMGTVQLMLGLSEEFGIELSPSEIERKLWATPNKIVEFMEQRLGV